MVEPLHGDFPHEIGTIRELGRELVDKYYGMQGGQGQAPHLYNMILWVFCVPQTPISTILSLDLSGHMLSVLLYIYVRCDGLSHEASQGNT